MFKNNSFAKVWRLGNKRENSQSIQITCSHKAKGSDEYVTDFSSYVLLVGKAFEKAGSIKERDTIKLTEVGVRSLWNKEKQIQESTFYVYDFEEVGPKAPAPASPAPAAAAEETDEDIDF